MALAFFQVEVCTYGTIKSLGVFLEDLMEDFQETNSRVSWVVSICVFVFTFTAPLSTWLSKRFGHRPVVMTGGFLISLGTISSAFANSITQMYVTIGLVSGLGYCLTFLPTITLLAQYFSRRRALVTSCASSGECVAMFSFAPALSSLKRYVGWRYCLVLLGVFQSSVIVCGLVLRPLVLCPVGTPEDGEVLSLKETGDRGILSLKETEDEYRLENEQTKTSLGSGSEDSGVMSLSASNPDLRTAGEGGGVKEEKPVTPPPPPHLKEDEDVPRLLDVSVLRDPVFVCYSLFGLLATLGFFAPQLYVVPLSVSRGVDAWAAPYTLSAMAGAELCGRLCMGAVLGRARRRCRMTSVLLACVVLLALALLLFPFTRGFWGLAAAGALYGFFMGAVGSAHIPLLAEDELLGVAGMASSAGVYVSIQSFAGLAGPPLGGLLVDVTHNYGAAFYCCAAGMSLSAVCLALLGPARRRRGREERRRGEEVKKEEVKGESQDSEQQDFLDVDLVPEDRPAERQEHMTAVI